MKQTKPLSLRHNFSWSFIGNTIYAACQWGMLVVIAKLGSSKMLGQFTLGLAVTAPVVMFTNLQLRAIQATDTKGQYLFSDYLGLRLLSTGLALVMIASIGVLSGYRWETLLVILLVGLAKACESVSDVVFGLLQQYERMDLIAMSLIIKGPLSLLLLGIGLHLSGNLIWGVVGLILAWLILLFGCDLRCISFILKDSLAKAHPEQVNHQKLAYTLQPRWHLVTLKKLVWLSLPLGFVMMLLSLNTNIPRYFIERYLGERELGIFAALVYLMVAGNIVIFALGESASPRLAKYYAGGDGIAFRKLLFKLVGIGAVVGGTGILVALVAGRQILTLVYHPEYAQRADLFVWIMVAAAIGYISSFLGYALTAARYIFIQIPISALVTTILAIVCFWLIPVLGLQGAVLALLIGEIVQIVIIFVAIAYTLHSFEK